MSFIDKIQQFALTLKGLSITLLRNEWRSTAFEVLLPIAFLQEKELSEDAAKSYKKSVIGCRANTEKFEILPLDAAFLENDIVVKVGYISLILTVSTYSFRKDCTYASFQLDKSFIGVTPRGCRINSLDAELVAARALKWLHNNNFTSVDIQKNFSKDV